MYSRNISFPERATSIRNVRQGEYRTTQSIPIKSYTDRSAYEHFGNMGKGEAENAHSKPLPVVEIPASYTEKEDAEKNSSTESAVIPTESDNKHFAEEALAVPTERSDNHSDFSLKDIIPKISKFFDCDIILPIFAISLFLLGDKDSGNTVTSIALIAIMLL